MIDDFVILNSKFYILYICTSDFDNFNLHDNTYKQ